MTPWPLSATLCAYRSPGKVHLRQAYIHTCRQPSTRTFQKRKFIYIHTYIHTYIYMQDDSLASVGNPPRVPFTGESSSKADYKAPPREAYHRSSPLDAPMSPGQAQGESNPRYVCHLALSFTFFIFSFLLATRIHSPALRLTSFSRQLTGTVRKQP